MLGTLVRLVGFDLKRQIRQITLSIVFALLGAFAALVALAIAFRALYLGLELAVGTFAALGILGGASTMLAVIFFFLAFRRRRRTARKAHPLRASTPSLAETTDAALGATEEFWRNGSRQQVVGALIVAVIAGWILGKRM